MAWQLPRRHTKSLSSANTARASLPTSSPANSTCEEAAARLPEVDPLADEFDVLTEAPETGVMELEDANESPEEPVMENEVTV